MRKIVFKVAASTFLAAWGSAALACYPMRYDATMPQRYFDSVASNWLAESSAIVEVVVVKAPPAMYDARPSHRGLARVVNVHYGNAAIGDLIPIVTHPCGTPVKQGTQGVVAINGKSRLASTVFLHPLIMTSIVRQVATLRAR